MKLSCCEVEAVHVASLIDVLRKKGRGKKPESDYDSSHKSSFV